MTDPVPLPTLLARMTRELRRVEKRLINLEHAIGDMVLEAPSPRSLRFHELQEIDRVRQEISEIAAFLDGIGLSALPEWLVDAQRASETLRLATLASALTCDEESEAGSGEYEHFA
jgi:hypothetical protein